ncbi:GAF and ANTAR domain-containing protein [Nocardioides sp. GCM10028917]|uniref:GAF and ANTAR domain-containing protein n=1 Tax=Nocardioides sp. GCM10028917 TaxID=3273408 RepID=UPI00361F4E8D
MSRSGGDERDAPLRLRAHPSPQLRVLATFDREPARRSAVIPTGRLPYSRARVHAQARAARGHSQSCPHPPADIGVTDRTLFDELKQKAALAQRIAPDLAGISVASLEHGITFTMVARDDEMAALDCVQYATSGPCVEVVDDGQGLVTTSEDLFNEPRWRAFAQASAAAGVRSTLTFPIMDGDEVSGTVNLYGRTETAFDGKRAALAVIFRAWAPGAVTNADLSFSTRLLAEQAPAKLRNDATIDEATGILAAYHQIPLDRAREQLKDSAARAGLPLEELARMIVKIKEHEL